MSRIQTLGEHEASEYMKINSAALGFGTILCCIVLVPVHLNLSLIVFFDLWLWKAESYSALCNLQQGSSDDHIKFINESEWKGIQQRGRSLAAGKARNFMFIMILLWWRNELWTNSESLFTFHRQLLDMIILVSKEGGPRSLSKHPNPMTASHQRFPGPKLEETMYLAEARARP